MPVAPLQQWLYRFYDEVGVLLYVGVTQCGEERFTEHAKDKAWWSDVADHTIQTYETRADVLLAERHAIYREKPRYNVAHNSTGRRLYGPNPIPASQPLTREAMERAACARMLEAWGDGSAEANLRRLERRDKLNASEPAVLDLTTFRSRRGRMLREQP